MPESLLKPASTIPEARAYRKAWFRWRATLTSSCATRWPAGWFRRSPRSWDLAGGRGLLARHHATSELQPINPCNWGGHLRVNVNNHGCLADAISHTGRPTAALAGRYKQPECLGGRWVQSASPGRSRRIEDRRRACRFHTDG